MLRANESHLLVPKKAYRRMQIRGSTFRIRTEEELKRREHRSPELSTKSKDCLIYTELKGISDKTNRVEEQEVWSWTSLC